MIDFLDLNATVEPLRSQVDDAISRVVTRGRFVLGPELEAFEEEFATYAGAKYCVGVGNGLDALTLALRAVGVQPGDEVIVPAHTFIATWLAVSLCGAVPVAVDADALTMNLKVSEIEDRITPKTTAIVPVHLYGRPVEMRHVEAIAAKHGLAVVQDAAQAHGAQLHGAPMGAFGTAAWSFYPGKNLGAFGDGGAITTDDPELAKRLRLERNYGSSERYRHEVQGVNSRLDELQASVLRAKLPYLDQWNRQRAAIADFYNTSLADTVAVTALADASDCQSSWHLYVVQIAGRSKIQSVLSEAGVQTLIHYPVPPHKQPAYRHLPTQHFPVAEALAESVLSLPIGPHIAMAEAEQVVDAFKAALVTR